MSKNFYKIITILAITMIGMVCVAWSNPIKPPKEINSFPPINVGSEDQSKNGSIGFNVGSASEFCFSNGQCIKTWQDLCDKGYLNCAKVQCEWVNVSWTAPDYLVRQWVSCPGGMTLVYCANNGSPGGCRNAQQSGNSCIATGGGECKKGGPRLGMTCVGQELRCR